MADPSLEEFTAWAEHPITRWVMDACRIAAEDAKALWIIQSWETGQARPESLIELRARAQTYTDITQLTHDDLVAAHNPTEE